MFLTILRTLTARFQEMSMLLFDQRDQQLLNIVNEVLSKDPTRQYRREMVYPYLHPRGIKELSESKGLRIAFPLFIFWSPWKRGR
jgi:hypothetical protein